VHRSWVSANEQQQEKRCLQSAATRGVPRVCHFRRPYQVPHTQITRNVVLVSNGVGFVDGVCAVPARAELLQRSGRRQGSG
jgi:hypothetical protein